MRTRMKVLRIDPRFGRLVRRRRRRLGFSLRQLAEATGASPSYLCRMEAGNRDAPSEKVIRKIAVCLELDPDSLILLSGRVPLYLQDELSRSSPSLLDLVRRLLVASPEKITEVERVLV